MAEPGSTPIAIDTDPGTDDAIAILMALGSPEVQVLGLTTVGGNVPLARATRNARALLEYNGRDDIPVAPGAARPMSGQFRYALPHHGPGGMAVRLPRPSHAPQQLRAIDFLRRTLASSATAVTVVALGPLTNIARLVQDHPGPARRVARLVVMGGAVDVPGNTTPYAEFNIHNDARAAYIVLSTGLPITLVDLGATHQVTLGREQVSKLSGGGPRARLVSRILSNWFRLFPDRQSYTPHDAVAMALALRSDLATVETANLRVVLEPQDRRGQVVRDPAGTPVQLVREVNMELFLTLFNRSLGMV